LKINLSSLWRARETFLPEVVIILCCAIVTVLEPLVVGPLARWAYDEGNWEESEHWTGLAAGKKEEADSPGTGWGDAYRLW